MSDLAGAGVGIGSALAGLAAVISSFGTWRQGRKTHALAVSTDNAVNGKESGEPTMVSQVQDLHDQLPEGNGMLPTLRRIETMLKNGTQ